MSNLYATANKVNVNQKEYETEIYIECYTICFGIIFFVYVYI